MERRTIAETSPSSLPGLGAEGSACNVLRFDGFEFDLQRGELTGRDGAPVALRPKAVSLLRLFLDRPGVLLGRAELLTELWPNLVVTDDSLVQCVGELRAALGDRGQRLIHTVPRRGYRFEAKVERVMRTPGPAVTPTELASPSHAADRSRARSPRRVWAVAAIAVGTALGVAAWQWRAAATPPGIDAAIEARHTVAVMPFAVEPGDPGLRGIADRLADRIVAQLAAQPRMRAFGPSRTAALSGAPAARAATELGAVYVLTGRVSPATAASQAASVELQLVTAEDGVVRGAERLDVGRAPDALDQVGQEVVNFMRGPFGVVDAARATRAGHVPDAVDLTQLGWIAVYRRQGAADRATARAHFEQALAADPDSIAALTGLGAVYIQERQARAPLTPEQRGRAEQAIERALRLAPNDATAPMLWGQQQALDGRPDLAIPALEKANRLTPGYVNGHLTLGRLLLCVGRIDEAPREAERAAKLAALSRDPVRLSASLQLGAEIAIMQRDDARALVLARRAVAEWPANALALAVLAAAEALAGEAAQSEAAMAASRRLLPEMTVERFDQNWPSKEPRYVAARARFHEGLRAAGMPDR